MSVLAHVAPKELQQSIFMHADSLDSYNKVRTYIKQCLSAQFAETTSGRTVWRNKLYQTEGKSKRTGPNGHWGSPQWTLGQSKEKAKAKRVNSKGKTDKGEGKGKIQQQQWNQAWQTQTQTWDPKYASDKGDDKPGKHKGNTLVLL